MQRSHGWWLAVLAALAVAAGCGEKPAMIDGGTAGGSVDSGALGGGAAGGSSQDSGVDAGEADAGVDAGVDAGTDSRFLIGERCDPALLTGLITSCRVEPLNPFQASRCLSIRLPDGGAQPPEEVRRILEQGSDEACSAFGAARLRCVAPQFPACVTARADGGLADRVIQSAIDACDRQLGTRFDQPCLDTCADANTRCTRGCDTSTLETCTACAHGCGREYIGCARRCLLLPDAGYTDAGP